MKKISVRNIGKKTLIPLGKALMFILEKGDDLIFEMNYPSLCNLMDHAEARDFLNRKYGRIPPTIRHLQKNHWAETKKIGDKIIIKLTQDGKVAATQFLIAKNRSMLPDGKIIILSFDIPESSRLLREMFRNSLRRMGFKKIQQSVWMTRKDVGNLLKKYLRLLKISRWVLIYLAKERK